MKQIAYILWAMLATVATVACSSDEPAPTEDPVCYDLVCLQSNDNGSVFTLTKPGSEDVITYNTRQVLPESQVKPGERVLISYTLHGQKPYTSGAITLRGYSPVTNLTVKKISLDTIPMWDADPVFLISAWKSETYLNIRALLPVDSRPRALAVGVDVNTLTEEVPQCYLVHCRESMEPTFDRNYYISADMSPMLTWCDAYSGFTLNLNDSNLNIKQLNFK